MRILICLSAIILIAQIHHVQAQTLSAELDFRVVDGDTVIYYVDSAPVFPGGDEALVKYFKKHLPKLKFTGKEQSSDIWITFVIRKDGSIGKMNIIANDKPDLNKLLVNAIKSLPAFMPAVWNGKPVATIGEITFDY
jgi:hypothetical protein